jgi:hypothetical protein
LGIDVQGSTAHRHDPIEPGSKRLLTFASGGWVILLVLLVCGALVVWAVAPAVLRLSTRPPGDGKSIESFAFDLSNLAVPRELVVAAMMHRDMVPALDSPTHSGPDDAEPRWQSMQRRNDPKYGKYLVSGDLVIGVSIDQQARCYPLHVMYVHEIVNDTLAGTPICVTYNWLSDSAVVFDRRINGALQGTAVFAASGLVYNSNLLMYDRHQTRTTPDDPWFGGGGEALWSQLLGRPISGSPQALESSLTIIRSELTTWRDWSARHPHTTVVDRDLSMTQRYKDAAPTQYFTSSKILFPVQKASPSSADDLEPKARVLAVITSEACRVYPIAYVLSIAQPQQDSTSSLVEWTDVLAGRRLRFIGDRSAQTLRVESDPPDPEMFTVTSFWFAWHAMHPDDQLMPRRAEP